MIIFGDMQFFDRYFAPFSMFFDRFSRLFVCFLIVFSRNFPYFSTIFPRRFPCFFDRFSASFSMFFSTLWSMLLATRFGIDVCSILGALGKSKIELPSRRQLNFHVIKGHILRTRLGTNLDAKRLPKSTPRGFQTRSKANLKKT